MNVTEADLPASILSSLDVAVLEWSGADAFHLVGQPPHWLEQLSPNWKIGEPVHPSREFLYVQHFLPEATNVWHSNVESEWLSSGVWTEVDPEGREWILEAVAMVQNGHKLLLLKQPSTSPERIREILQEGREQSIEFSRLIKEINKREILLHCIVHDLSTPLAGIKGSLTLLKDDDMVREGGHELLEIGLNQVHKLQALVRNILHAFADEIEPLVPRVVEDDAAPSIRQRARDIIRLLAPLAQQQDIRLEITPDSIDAKTAKVSADPDRLDRVLLNLIDNALRHAPTGSAIDVRIADCGNAILTEVIDQGPGIRDRDAESLFDRFRQGDSGGQVGLGLYFCKITVEDWGGTLGFRPGNDGGSVFWFKVPKSGAQAGTGTSNSE